MLKISGPVGAIGFVSVFLLSGAGASLSIDSARADTCLAAPKTAAPSGQHWYYHIDRATRHKCWYLHGAVQLHHHALIRHHAAEAAADAEPAGEPQTAAGPQTAAAPAAMADPPAQPVAPPTAPAAAPDSAAGNAAAAPHVTVLAVRPSTPFVSTAAAPQRSAPETPPAPPTQQPALHDESTPAGVSVKPADGPQSAQRQDKADATYNAPAQSADAATNAARTRTAEMFILLALVFGAAAAVIAIVSKVLGMYRRPRISDDPDAAWLRYRSARQQIDAEAISDGNEVPFLDPQEHYGLGDLHTQEWLDRSPHAQDRSAVSPPQSPPANQPDIEPALRALRQARRSGVA